MPDVEKIGGPNLNIYRTQDEYIELIQKARETRMTYSINLEKHSWKEKARNFEDLLHEVV